MSKDTTDDETLRQEINAVVVGLIRTFAPDETLTPLAEGETYQAYDRDSANAAIMELLTRHVQAARLDEHNQMISMIKATDMQTQYKEYWRAGNIRLAKLQEERIAALQAQPLTDKDSV